MVAEVARKAHNLEVGGSNPSPATNIIIIMKKTEEIRGWFTHDRVYDYLIEKTPIGGSILELGAWLGKSSSYLADKAGDRNVIIVDSWKGSPNELGTTHILATQTDIYEIFKENMGDRKYQSIRGLSKDVSEQFEDESLDVVFIDATHTYPAVKQDIQLWLPKVKTGGILAGHDYEPNFPGVVRAVDELLPNKEIKSHCWIYHKK